MRSVNLTHFAGNAPFKRGVSVYTRHWFYGVAAPFRLRGAMNHTAALKLNLKAEATNSFDYGSKE
jgi:hypothetical protein